MKSTIPAPIVALLPGLLLAGPAVADSLSFYDPTGDDNGPGSYLYPTDSV